VVRAPAVVGAGDSQLDTVFPNLRNFTRDLGFMKA
jgi:hypothetical protein